MYRIYYSVLLVSLFAISLSAQQEIPFAKGITTIQDIKLSSIAEKIEYIPLETTEECLLRADIMDITLTDDYLFVCDHDYVYQFTPQGKFLRRIGKKGQGPGEYTQSILGVVYNDAKKEIIMTDFRTAKALIYSYNGEYLRSFKTANELFLTYFKQPDLIYGYSSAFLISRDQSGKDLFVYNDKGKVINDFRFNYQKGKRYPGLIFSLGLFYGYKGDVFYKNPLEDIVFKIDGKKKIPTYRFNLEQFEKLNEEEDAILAFDKKKNIGTNLPNPAAEKKINFIKLFETNPFLFIAFGQENEYRTALYDKAKDKVYRVHSKKTNKPGFTDDLEGGFPFWPVNHSGNVMISCIGVDTIQEFVKPSEVKGSLKKILPTLQEDDNPVIQIVYLKEN